MIVASTRAKRGLSRWFLGSFVETLSTKSQIPLFIVNPSWKRNLTFNDILFPTDLSQESYEAFQKVLPFAKIIGSQVHLFHKLSEVTPLWPPGPGWAPPDWDEERQNGEMEAIQLKGSEWIKEAKKRGVLAQFEIDKTNNCPVVEAILRKSKTGSYLIALASKSGPIEASFLGSVARELIRHSSDPLWIIHPPTYNNMIIQPDYGTQIENANEHLRAN